MTAVTPGPFTLDVPASVLQDPRARLAAARWPDEAPAPPWNYGTSLAYLRGLVDEWRDRFDRRAQEGAPQRALAGDRALAGIELHSIHAEGREPDLLPLFLSHGGGRSSSSWRGHGRAPRGDPGVLPPLRGS
jgi:hypothetical protein